MRITTLGCCITVGLLLWAAFIAGGALFGFIALGATVVGLLLGAALFGKSEAKERPDA